MDKQWYSVKLIYQFIVTGEPDDVDSFYSEEQDIFEESIILVKADSFDEAYIKAEKYGKENEEIYTNRYHQTVSYQFVDSLDCYCLGADIEDETQVYSSIRAVGKGTGAERYIDDMLKNELDIHAKHTLMQE